jgi:hypothetical protein
MGGCVFYCERQIKMAYNKEESFGEEFEDTFEATVEATIVRGLCVHQEVAVGSR